MLSLTHLAVLHCHHERARQCDISALVKRLHVKLANAVSHLVSDELWSRLNADYCAVLVY